MIGMQRESLSRLINGANTSVETLERIAAALGVQITELFDEPSPNDEINGIAEYKGEFYKIRTVADLKALLAIADKNFVDDPKIPDHKNIRGKEYYK
jgi:transcriptional regulator with XRE-family HTH domain